MRKILVHTKKQLGTCTVLIGADAGEAAVMAAKLGASRAAVVCSKNTAAIALRVATAAGEAGLGPCLLEIPDGEKNKSLATLELLLQKMLEENLDRDAAVIAVGGGVVGDVAGFAASVYLRGVSLIHVPTTLVAMADSSVGGKTGVNFGGKNMVGAFHQPKAVVVDFSTLKTLPGEEVRQGLAEILKTACIRSPSLFKFLEENAEKALALDETVLARLVGESIEIKADIVGCDEREDRSFEGTENSRMLLNFGHSLGHGLEKASGYSLRHGDAVSAGIVGECKISQQLGLLEERESGRIKALLQKLGLPTGAAGVSLEKAVAALQSDKKNKSGKLVMVLLHAIGRPEVVSGVQPELARLALAELVGK